MLALGLGVQLRGYDMIDFALPMEQHHIQDLNQQMKENNWTLPAFNITSGQKQNEYHTRIKAAWMSWYNKKQATHNINKVYVDASKVGSVTWTRVQTKLSQALRFFRDVWILNPHLTKEAAHKLAEKLVRTHVKTQNARKRFFTLYTAQIREQIAHQMLDEMGASLGDEKTEFDEPLAACEEIGVILGHLGMSAKGGPRACFDRLKDWYDSIPLKAKAKRDRFEWFDDVDLQPLPEEIIKRQKLEAAEAKKAAKLQATQTAAPAP